MVCPHFDMNRWTRDTSIEPRPSFGPLRWTDGGPSSRLPVAGAMAGTSFVSWLDRPLQRTATSSLWEQSVRPQIPCPQSSRDVSVPSQRTSSRRIRPAPSPYLPSLTTSAWPLEMVKDATCASFPSAGHRLWCCVPVAQLSADHRRVLLGPVVVTRRPPVAVVEDLDSALPGTVPSHQAHNPVCNRGVKKQL